VTSLDPEVGLRGWEEQLEALLLKFPLAGVGECGLDKGTRIDVWVDQMNGWINRLMDE
jgi:hypothetical protein